MRAQSENPSDESREAIQTEGSSESSRALPGRLERYGKAKSRSREMSLYLETKVSETGAKKIALRLGQCSGWLLFRNYLSVDRVKLLQGSFCRKHLLCPMCALRRGGKALRAYLERFRALKAENPGLNVSLITLTVKNGPDLAERMDHLQRGVSLMNHRRRNDKQRGGGVSQWSKVLGYVGSYETTNKGKGWHPHGHFIVLHTEPIDNQKLIDEWHRTTLDSFILDVQQIAEDGLDGAFCEVFKYALKFGDLDLDLNWQAFKVLRGRRLLVSGGIFRGVVVPDDLRDEPLSDDLPYIDMLFKYDSKKGYEYCASLEKDDRPKRIRMADMMQQQRKETPF